MSLSEFLEEHKPHQNESNTRIFLCMDSEEYFRLKQSGSTSPIPQIMIQDYSTGMKSGSTNSAINSGISFGDEESGFMRTQSTASSIYGIDHVPPIVKPVTWSTSKAGSHNLSSLLKIAAEAFSIPLEQTFLLRLIAFGNGIVPLMPVMIDNDIAVSALRNQDYVQICPIEKPIASEETLSSPRSTDELISKLIMRVLKLPNPLRRRKRDEYYVSKLEEDIAESTSQIEPTTKALSGNPNEASMNNSIQSMQTNTSAMSVADNQSVSGLGPVSNASGSAIILSNDESSVTNQGSNKSEDIDFKFIDGHGPILSFRAQPRTPFMKSVRRYLVERNLHGLKTNSSLLSQMVFKRNGNPIDISQKVGEMNLQDGEQILVTWSESLCLEMFSGLSSDVIDISD